MNNISNMSQYHLDHYTEELTKAEKHHSAGLLLMKFAMVVTLILYGLFTVHLYLGNGLSWGEYFKTTNGTIWFFTMLVVATLLSVFLAWVKHFAYTHFSKFAPVTSVVFTVIAFALFAEFFSSSANQDAKSHAILNTDSAYQQTVKQQSPTITTNSRLAGDIAKAEQRLARCYENLKRGKEKHCRGDKAKVSSLKQSQKASGDIQVQASVAMQSMNYARQDKLKADSHNPTIVTVAKLMSGLLGGSYSDYIKIAILLVMVLVASAFEKLHHFLSGALKESDWAIQHNKRKLAQLNDQTVDAVSYENETENNNSGFGFVPATAQKEDSNSPRFKYQDQSMVAEKQPIGFVNTDNNYLSPDDSYNVPTPSETAQYVACRNCGKQTNTTVGANGFCSLKCEGKNTSPLSTSERQNDLDLTMPSNRAQTVPEKSKNNRAQTVPNRASTVEVQARSKTGTVQSKEEKKDLEAEKKGADLLFPEWKRAVLNNNCKTSVRGSRGWIRQRIKQSKNVVHRSSREYVSNIVDRLFEIGVKEGFMHLNPKYTGAKSGVTKYLLTRL